MNQQLFSAQATAFALTGAPAASAAVAIPFSANAIRIVNEGPNVMFVAIGDSSVSATLPGAVPGTRTSTPVLPSSDVTLGMAAGQQYISCICRAAGSAVATVQPGEGM